jgi:hypothetical protein
MTMVSGLTCSGNLNKENSRSMTERGDSALPQIFLLICDEILHDENASRWVDDLLPALEMNIASHVGSQAENALWLQTNRLVHRELLFLFHFVNFQKSQHGDLRYLSSLSLNYNQLWPLVNVSPASITAAKSFP